MFCVDSLLPLMEDVFEEEIGVCGLIIYWRPFGYAGGPYPWYDGLQSPYRGQRPVFFSACRTCCFCRRHAVACRKAGDFIAPETVPASAGDSPVSGPAAFGRTC